MDENNKPRKGPDAAFWRQAEHEEFISLLEHTKTMSFIAPHSKPSDRICSYYNPQVKLKIKSAVPTGVTSLTMPASALLGPPTFRP